MRPETEPEQPFEPGLTATGHDPHDALLDDSRHHARSAMASVAELHKCVALLRKQPDPDLIECQRLLAKKYDHYSGLIANPAAALRTAEQLNLWP